VVSGLRICRVNVAMRDYYGKIFGAVVCCVVCTVCVVCTKVYIRLGDGAPVALSLSLSSRVRLAAGWWLEVTVLYVQQEIASEIRPMAVAYLRSGQQNDAIKNELTFFAAAAVCLAARRNR
jgi:hypothetical protein